MLTLRPTRFLTEPFVLEGLARLLEEREASYAAGLQVFEDLYTGYFHFDGRVQAEQGRKLLMRIEPHMGRVLQREEALTRFFKRLPRRFEAAGVRVVSLEDRYPVARYLVPGDRLADALHILDRALMLDLLDVHAVDLGLHDVVATQPDFNLKQAAGAADAARMRRLRRFLCSYVQNLLVGTALIFKHKQALYLMLRADERLHHQLEPAAVLAMGLADMRGTLVDRGQLHGNYRFAEWDDLARAFQKVDRRSLDGLMRDWDRYARLSAHAPEAAEALAGLVQARWQIRAQAVGAQDMAILGQSDQWQRARTAYFLARLAEGRNHSGEDA
jgi:hypothetical protein